MKTIYFTNHVQNSMQINHVHNKIKQKKNCNETALIYMPLKSLDCPLYEFIGRFIFSLTHALFYCVLRQRPRCKRQWISIKWLGKLNCCLQWMTFTASGKWRVARGRWQVASRIQAFHYAIKFSMLQVYEHIPAIHEDFNLFVFVFILIQMNFRQ